jgi:hypothetical protein
MAKQEPSLTIQTAVRDLGKYFHAMEFSAFYDMLKSELDFTAELKDATTKELMPKNIAGDISNFLLNFTQGGMTAFELLNLVKERGYKAMITSDERQVTLVSDNTTETVDPDLFNKTVLITYEDLGAEHAPLNALSKDQGWSQDRNAKPDGNHVFSLHDMLYKWSSDAPVKVNENKTSIPTKSKPALSVVQVFDQTYNISNHNGNALQIFLNAIPTLEMSRAVPYFNLQVISAMSGLDDELRPQTPSLFQFLEGSPKLQDTPDAPHGSVDMALASARSRNVFDRGFADAAIKQMAEEGKGDDTIPATAGMELFTSPQTLVNATEVHESITSGNEENALRSAPVLDRFRPLMTIKSFSVNLVPSQGLIANKTAKLSLVLHDRSRLAEIAQLVKPDLYARSELLVEYGWSHPAGEISQAPDSTGYFAPNAFGAFINACRMREKYGIVNSQFSFESDGSVTISLELSVKGGMVTANTSIAMGEGVEDVHRQMKDLVDAIKKSQKSTGSGYAKDIQGFQVLESITDTQAAATFDNKTMKQLGEFAKTTKDSTIPAVSEIRNSLIELYGPNVDGKAGAAADLNRTISASVAKKVRLLSRGSDPFLRKLRFKKGTKSKATPNVRTGGKGRRSYVSLGKLLMIFVGAPLAATRQFDEVQFVFYGFNSKASYMHDFNIAQFPIHIETFKEKFDQLKKVTANIPITQFVEFVNKEFLSTQDTNAYGLVHTFTDGDNTEKRKDWFAKGTRLSDEINRILKDAYNSAEISPEFILPFMKMSIETVPVNYKTQSNDTAGTSVERTIMRIHLMDAAASSNDGLLEVLKATREENMGFISGLAPKSDEPTGKKRVDNQKKFVDALAAAVDAKLFEPVPAVTQGDPEDQLAKDLAAGKISLRIKGGFPAIKNFISKGMPSITIGSQNSAVNSANLASINDPNLKTVMILDGGPKGGNTAQGARSAGLPLTVMPVELSLDTHGFPLWQFSQQIFIDFQTGTNVDNVYVVYGVDHSIGPGEFKTSVKLRRATDAFGAYRALSGNIADALMEIKRNS